MTPKDIREKYKMDDSEWNTDKADVLAVRVLGEILAELVELNGNFRIVNGIESPIQKEE
jgi:hypothetical protein